MDRIGLLCVPYGNAGRIKGAEIGARFLCGYLLSHGKIDYYDKISFFSDSDARGLECMNEIIIVGQEIKKKVYEWCLSGNKMIIIGGDHSISLGSISGADDVAAVLGEKFGVIYIDAHADMNTPFNSPTKNLHGTTLAASMGVGEKGMTDIADNPLEPSDLLLIGARSLDEGEIELIDRLNVNVISSEEINSCSSEESKFEAIFDKINSFVKRRGIQRIHLSLDIDVIEPRESPATGVPESDGISVNSFLKITKFIISKFNVFTVDVVEYFPELDKSGKTERILQRLCDTLVDSL